MLHFQHVRLAYLGGLWVMIKLTSVQTKMRFMKHVGVASWFSQLCKAQSDFVSRERIVWIDVEGVPLHAWSRPTFSKIGSRWGEVIELEDNKEDVLLTVTLESRWNWTTETDIESCGLNTVLMIRLILWGHEHTQNLSPNEKENSSDPFNLYNLLNKRDKGEANSGLDSSIPFPPRFTPKREFQHVDAQEGQGLGSKAKKDWIRELNNKHKGFDQMVLETWNNIDLDDKNKMVRFKKKLQILKKEIRSWVNDCKKNQSGRLVDLRSKLCHIDKVIDQGGVNDDILLTRAKELFIWSLTFNDNKEVDNYSEDDSVNGAEEINGDISKQMNLDDKTDIEGVSDTVFDDNADSLGHEHTQNLSPNEKENS
ncbi:RNA-directed DNA polymerase, eukaryota [Tanacetum coccineum]|uniref:RNA-directed DNA polymerase, eukaryota n=1 Tax=Tanacetum coccineum TaxID=301880 RepID=A0ABQ4Y5X8_9ASTR